MAMVKGDAYGHGVSFVAAAALEAGATWLGVSLLDEGLRLREAGFTAPVLVTSECPAGSEGTALEAGLTLSVYTDGGARRLARTGRLVRQRPSVHVKVDTGLNRVGVPHGHAVSFVARLVRAGMDLEGVWTHLAKSEEIGDDFTARQLTRFRAVLAGIRADGHRPRLVHAANTAAIMAWPSAYFDLVRPGIGMYGVSPGAGLPNASRLCPALSWRSEVVLTKRVPKGEGISYGLTYRTGRESTIATVPVGFADGYPRQLSNQGELLIRGRRYPIAGLIAMDHLMVDCGDDTVRPGDQVTLIGRQGEQSVTVDEVAAWAHTIPDEVFCGISPRVPREYVGGHLALPVT